MVMCWNCNGTGSRDVPSDEPCPICDGDGEISAEDDMADTEPRPTRHGVTWTVNDDGSWESSDWRFTIIPSDGVITVRDMVARDQWTEHESIADAVAYVESVWDDDMAKMKEKM